MPSNEALTSEALPCQYFGCQFTQEIVMGLISCVYALPMTMPNKDEKRKVENTTTLH